MFPEQTGEPLVTALTVEQQDWVLGATYDHTFCHKCEGETHLVEVELKPEPQD